MKAGLLMKRLLGVLLVLLTIGISPALATPNLIVDGSFESPIVPATYNIYAFSEFALGSSIDGVWNVVGGSASTVAIVSDTWTGAGVIAENAQNGVQSLDLTGNTDNGYANSVEQTVALTVGRSYQLSFYVGTSYGGTSQDSSPVSLLLSVNGGPNTTYTNPNFTVGYVNWEPFSTTFVASSASEAITFTNASPNPILYTGLDNVSLIALPEPSAMWAVAAIAGLLLPRWGRMVGHLRR